MSGRIKEKKINGVVVKSVPILHKEDKRPIKGFDLFPEIYANVFLCAKKKSGKTSSIYTILKECAGKDTKVIAFVSTLNKDANWKTIRAWCDLNKIEFEGHTSLKEDGIDQLDLLVDELQEEIHDEEDVNISSRTKNILKFDSDSDDEETKRKKKKKEKYIAPEYIIILDDLSNELKSKSLVTLLKKNRHFKAKIIVSSQYLNDLLPEARKQMDYFLCFRGQSKKKLEEIHRDADVNLEVEDFIDLYEYATSKLYSFLYIDTNNSEFRRNFNTLLDV